MWFSIRTSRSGRYQAINAFLWMKSKELLCFLVRSNIVTNNWEAPSALFLTNRLWFSMNWILNLLSFFGYRFLDYRKMYSNHEERKAPLTGWHVAASITRFKRCGPETFLAHVTFSVLFSLEPRKAPLPGISASSNHSRRSRYHNPFTSPLPQLHEQLTLYPFLNQ